MRVYACEECGKDNPIEYCNQCERDLTPKQQREREEEMETRENKLDHALLEHTPLPWLWQKFGKEYFLTSQTKFRPIVLSGKKMTSLVNGLLVPFDPDHPDANFLEHAVNSYEELLEACVNALDFIENEAEDSREFTIELLRKAVAKAEGREL